MTSRAASVPPQDERGGPLPRNAAEGWAAARGAVLWLLFCGVAVLVRGVRWDESLEHAQTILRLVRYPEGHPHFIFYRNAFNLQLWAAAAQLQLLPSAALLCWTRNTLFLAATVVPVYLISALLTRRALFGHLAAALALAGIYLEFYCNYALAIWPGYYGYGPIGTGYALLTLYLFMSGRRAAYFLCGFMPCVHLGQTPAVALLLVIHLALTIREAGFRRAVPALRWAAAGAALCGLFWLIHRGFIAALPTEGPYAAAGDPHAIWAGYTFHFDRHRSFPVGNGHIALAGLVLLSLLTARAESLRTGRCGPWRWLCIYALAVAAIVWGAMAAYLLLGTRTPFLLIGWMPYRLMNHAPPLLLAAMVGILGAANGRDASSGARRPSVPGRLVLAGAMMLALARPALAVLLPEVVYARYLAGGEFIMFGLFGAAAAQLLATVDGGKFARVATLGLGAVALAALLYTHQFGALCVFVGAGAFLLVGRVCRGEKTPAARPRAWASHSATLGVLCFLCVGLVTAQEWRHREHLPTTAFEREVRAVLASQGEPDALLVADPWEFYVQVRTGHPVLAAPETPVSIISYMPQLAPAVQAIYGDIYGVHFTLDSTESVAYTWEGVWAARTAEEWRTLAAKYAFRYVMAPRSVPLPLREVVAADDNVLYAVNAGPSR